MLHLLAKGIKGSKKPMVSDVKKDAQTLLRLPSEWLLTIQQLSETVGITQQQLLLDAAVSWLGKKDEMADNRREMILHAFKSGRVKRPFDSRPPQRRIAAVSSATRALCCPV